MALGLGALGLKKLTWAAGPDPTEVNGTMMSQRNPASRVRCGVSLILSCRYGAMAKLRNLTRAVSLRNAVSTLPKRKLAKALPVVFTFNTSPVFGSLLLVVSLLKLKLPVQLQFSPDIC